MLVTAEIKNLGCNSLQDELFIPKLSFHNGIRALLNGIHVPLNMLLQQLLYGLKESCMDLITLREIGRAHV